jgi:hypothetical protein
MRRSLPVKGLGPNAPSLCHNLIDKQTITRLHGFNSQRHEAVRMR